MSMVSISSQMDTISRYQTCSGSRPEYSALVSKEDKNMKIDITKKWEGLIAV